MYNPTQYKEPTKQAPVSIPIHAMPTQAKSYISNHIKLDFFNNSNLKTDIQNRSSKNIGSEFIKQLQDIRGDKATGVSFSEITLLAIAYFYTEIFTDKIEDKHYSLDYVKGFLDGNNLSSYTAIHEIDIEFSKLKNAPYFNHCWLIIQSAWFFNSNHFGSHQHIDYVNHFINTGQKLPIENYKFDKEYLEKKYGEVVGTKKKKIEINGFTLVNNWYTGILFLICKELQLPTTHFKITTKDNREYNPLPKTSRQLRMLAPFKIIECDIKSAFPTFLDLETGANLKDHVYNNLMLSKGITRNNAKKLFNSVCNSSKYKTPQETISFFLSCGYTQTQCERLISLTHNPIKKFFAFMTIHEERNISEFIVKNQLQRAGRLHDAVLFIDNKIKPIFLNTGTNCDFGYKEMNRPVIRNTFMYGSRWLKYAYVNSIPKGLNLITKHEGIKPDAVGSANGFKFYTQKFKYINAGFNMNNPNDFGSFDKFSRSYNWNSKLGDIFISQCKVMIDTLCFLNDRQIRPFELITILNHMRQHSNYIFNVRGAYLRLIKYSPIAQFTEIERDFDIIQPLKFKKNIDFLNAMNEAKKVVNVQNNYGELIDLLEERITNDDYYFVNEIKIKGKRSNNLLIHAIILKFNMLCNGRKNKPIFDTLFIDTYIKGVLKIGLSDIEQKKERAKINRFKLKEKKIDALLSKNKDKAKQLYLILCEVAGRIPNIEMDPNIELQNELKTELMNTILKIDINSNDAGVIAFNHVYQQNQQSNQIKFNNDITGTFDGDLSNSIFNHIDPEHAHARGEVFFNEYINFNNVIQRKERIKYVHKPKEVYHMPEFIF